MFVKFDINKQCIVLKQCKQYYGNLPMHLQMALFEQNGSCGYVLKPEFMRDRSPPLFTRFDAFGKTVPGFKVKELTIEIISGQYLNPSSPSGSSYVELEVIGLPCDCNKYKTKPVSKNMVNPIWNEEFSFRIAFEESPSCVWQSSTTAAITSWRSGLFPFDVSDENVPLELSTLFILNRLTEIQEDELQNTIQKKELLTDLVYYYVGKELAENPRQNLAEASSVGVYGVEFPDEETLLWTTGDTKAGELLAEAIGRAGKPLEDLENYILEEEAVLNFRQGEEVQTEERSLEAEENVYEVQAAWNGKGRFVLKPAEVLAKAGMLDVDPEQYSLYEEKSKDGKNLNLDTSRKSSDKLIQRIMGDDEKPWDVQSQWITAGINGRFSVRDKNEEKSTSTSKLRRVTSLRQRKQKIMQSAAVQAKKVSVTGEISEGIIKPDSKVRKVSKLKIWKSS
ncbi:hypothetical protein BSL78_20340 [Apostichopus japonicus]|uniref:Phosphoinositide phospholipase C n=1 Tax=Stichopus japonicus TaxID=307972 RepID=A0A2G8K481_STIJA|nr:hypothetical protein BSL78_20340 [Apostichopus japonicus]